jgi:hypothetical protein
MSKTIIFLFGLALMVSIAACRTSHKIEVAPVEVKPIHITIDINVRVDKALDDYFHDLDNGAVQDKELSSPEE